MFDLHEPFPKSKTAIGLYRSLALQGHVQSAHTAFCYHKPYCDQPVWVYSSVVPRDAGARSGGFRNVEAGLYAPCRKCPKCLQFRQMKWMERADLEIRMAPRTWWVTLTFSPLALSKVLIEAEDGSPKMIERRAYADVQRWFKKIRKLHKLRYLCVYELGEENGRSHYHLLLHETTSSIPKRLLEGRWHSHVHARLVDRSRSGLTGYITKYATKNLDVRPRASQSYGRFSVSVFKRSLY